MPLLDELSNHLRATLPMGRIEPQHLPGCPELVLGLINADFPTGPLPGEVMRDVIETPAYWAFCWGSGLGLAQLIFAEPSIVAGRQIIDFGSGSGVVGIAAARCGAKRVIACDNDAGARAATRANAALNDVSIDIVAALSELPQDNDLVLMADVLYDNANLPLLDALKPKAKATVVADSRITEVPPGYRLLTTVEALTYPNLGEFDEFRCVRIFTAGQPLRPVNVSPAD
jgi:predicted nicotinamide N-methyase